MVGLTHVTHPKGNPMNHHPDLVLRFADDLRRVRLADAHQRRLVRSVRSHRAPSIADGVSPPRWHVHLPWRHRVLAAPAPR